MILRTSHISVLVPIAAAFLAPVAPALGLAVVAPQAAAANSDAAAAGHRTAAAGSGAAAANSGIAAARSGAVTASVSPLPRSDYGVRAVCRKPALRRAGCLSLQLVPETAEARSHTHPLGIMRARRATPSAPPSPAAGDFGLRPQDLHSAYRLPTTVSSAQTIALVDAYNDLTAEEDLATYAKEFGLPECSAANGCFAKVNQNGEAGNLPFPKSATELESARKGGRAKREEAAEATGWALEISLDVETAHAICQSCHILLVEANTPSYEDLEKAEHAAGALGAGEISNSWGGPEEGETPALEAASPFNHPGIVITAAAGDEGYLNWDAESSSEMGYVDFPASSPHVVAVGGTHLDLAEAGAWAGEVVWNGYGATAGGCSSVFTAQPWQQDVSDWSSVGCGGKRAVADVAADADPYTGVAVYDTSPECEYVYEEDKVKRTGHWCTIGGTSLASPLIASVFALSGGANGVEYPAKTLYENEARSPGSLHDITVGSNGECTQLFTETGLSGCTAAEEAESCDAEAICLAGPGYDGPSGVGTPDGLGAFDLSPASPPAVSTGVPSSVTQTSATLNGTVNPNGTEVTECRFEYGPSTSYGSSVPCDSSPGTGGAAVAVSAPIAGLTASTTYHFRLIAVNAGGAGYGADQTFATPATTAPGPPEFGRCVKVGKGTGRYASSSCTSLGGAGRYEWKPGASDAGLTTELISGSVLLETIDGLKVTCTNETSTGQYTGLKTVGDLVITLTGCELSGEPCSSGTSTGEIVSNALEGVLGVETLGASPIQDKIGLNLYSAGGLGPVMSFSCGATTVSVRGSVIVPIKANKMLLTQTLKFKASRGRQKPESFAQGSTRVLEASLDGAAPDQIGLTMTAALVNEENIEVNTVA